MATIEEQLARQEWEPMPGERLIGVITKIIVRANNKGKPYPILVIRDDSTATEYVVPQTALVVNDVIAYGPSIGDRVGIRYIGRKERPGFPHYDKYVIAFAEPDDQPDAVDWQAMREARGTNAQETEAPF